MPDGLDDARDAFANEIAPASQPRDQAGRFVATSSKPEPIFQPRPMEGGGDESDAGDPRDDQERRIADGRSEQGDDGARSTRAKPDAAQRSDAAEGI